MKDQAPAFIREMNEMAEKLAAELDDKIGGAVGAVSSAKEVEGFTVAAKDRITVRARYLEARGVIEVATTYSASQFGGGTEKAAYLLRVDAEADTQMGASTDDGKVFKNGAELADHVLRIVFMHTVLPPTK